MPTMKSVAKLLGGPKDGAVVLLTTEEAPDVLNLNPTTNSTYARNRCYTETVEGGVRTVYEYFHNSLKVTQLGQPTRN